MGGGLMQLVAYGAQDVYLTGNPQITFFKVVYRRHTNFSMETIQQTINGSSSIGASNHTGSITISRNGDLVYKVYVTSNTVGITDGDNLISEVEVEIGGQQIDRHYTEWNQIWNELTTVSSKALALKAMKSCVHGTASASGDTTISMGVGLVQIPLNFWFCRNPGLALPLIALQYHEVKLNITWGTSTNVGTTADCQVWCDYIYLDTDERRRFAQVSHEYLIEQLQKQSSGTTNSNKLNFNHPVKELIWTSNSNNTYKTAKLQLNGHDRFADQEEEYFQLRQPFDYHTAVPQNNLPGSHHPLLDSTGDQLITKLDNPIGLLHTNGQGLDSVACVTTGLTWVKIDGLSTPPTSVPGTGASLTNATTSSSAFIVGGLNNVSAIIANSLRIGDRHSIWATPMDAADITQLVFPEQHATVKYILLSNLASVDTKAEIKGSLGPLFLFPDSVQYVTEAHLIADSDADDITDATGGAILVVYDTEILFTTDKSYDLGSSSLLYTMISNMTDHRSFSAGSDPREAQTSLLSKKINVYSFALKPEEHQPSGTCNFSRIDTAKLMTGSALEATDNIYAVNYNVLRIMSGMGGLAYSN